MGGQETLLLVARHPRLLTGARRSMRRPTSRGATATSRGSRAAVTCRSSRGARSAGRPTRIPAPMRAAVRSRTLAQSRSPASPYSCTGASPTRSSSTRRTTPRSGFPTHHRAQPRGAVTAVSGRWTHSGGMPQLLPGALARLRSAPGGDDVRPCHRSSSATTTPSAAGRCDRTTGNTRSAAPSSTRGQTPSSGRSTTPASTSPFATTGPSRARPGGRTHRVYAIEGGVVEQATPSGRLRQRPRRPLRLRARRTPSSSPASASAPGQLIGWTCRGWWHLHLTEWILHRGTGGCSSTHSGRPGS